MTRANRGLVGLAIHMASAVRRAASEASKGSPSSPGKSLIHDTAPGVTRSPLSFTLLRIKRWVGSGGRESTAKTLSGLLIAAYAALEFFNSATRFVRRSRWSEVITRVRSSSVARLTPARQDCAICSEERAEL